MSEPKEFEFEFDLFKRSSSLIKSFDCIINKFIQKPFQYCNSSIGIVFACAAISPTLDALIKIMQDTTILAFQGIIDQRLVADMVKRLIVLNDLISETEKLDVMKQLIKEYDFTFKIKALNPNSIEYKSLDQFIKVAKSINPSLPENSDVISKVKIIVNDIFAGGTTFQSPACPHTFMALVGPFYHGKTQNAFNLSIQQPVFYVNFISGNKNTQAVYRAFNQISDRFKQDLIYDLNTLSTKSFKNDVNSIFDFRRIDYKTVGLIWSLVEISQKFDFNDSKQTWIKFYLAEREIQYDAMSIENFWMNMSKLIKLYFIFGILTCFFFIYRNFGSKNKEKISNRLYR